MVRAFSLLLFASVFLMASPKLRMEVWDGFALVLQKLDNASPYSYIVLGIVAIISFLIFVARGSQPL